MHASLRAPTTSVRTARAAPARLNDVRPGVKTAGIAPGVTMNIAEDVTSLIGKWI